MSTKYCLMFLLGSLIALSLPVNAASIDETVPQYRRASGISGNLSSIGSDTLANLMTLWAEEFQRLYPNVNVQVQAAGSSTAPPALLERMSNLGPMSREMKTNEIRAFESRYGYRPTAIPVAIDALAIYVHQDNPIRGLTMAQIDAIFSANKRCGYTTELTDWSDLGLDGYWAGRSIQLFGRNSVSGTYGYFKEKALCGGDFRKNVNEQPGSASVVQAVSASINGIGYSGIGYRTASVRSVPVAINAQADYIPATPAHSVSGAYPLARFLYIYVNQAPNRLLPPLEREFIKLVLSQSGQNIVIKDGYIPLPGEVIASVLQSLNI